MNGDLGVIEMAMAASIEELDQLGRSLDRLAASFEEDEQAETVTELAEGLQSAEERIAVLVIEAESCQRLADQCLLDVKEDWLARFERLFELVERTGRRLDSEADLRLVRHRAADSYLRNQAI